MSNFKKLSQKLLSQKGISLFADLRERGSGVIKELRRQGLNVKLKQLPVGDYLLSERVIIERKTKQDFNKSLIDGRLLKQAAQMKSQFGSPLLILEGIEDLYSLNQIHPNAIRGALAALTIDLGIPILPSKDIKDTALLIASIARREQKLKQTELRLRGEKKPESLRAQQIYLISSLPGVGPKLAKRLLKEFGSVRRFVNAPFERLVKVKLIGEKKARKIKQVLEREV